MHVPCIVSISFLTEALAAFLAARLTFTPSAISLNAVAAPDTVCSAGNQRYFIF
jgi:hypothetical protein